MDQDPKTLDPKTLEQMAYEFLTQEDYSQAFSLYQKAANIYKKGNNHEQAALCFASAASCWSKKSGEKTFYNAALSYQAAARQAEQSCDLEYAAMLYKYAAINYERDGEFVNFSDCFYNSKECSKRFFTYCIFNSQKIHPIMPSHEKEGITWVLRRIFLWVGLSFSNLLWGHGERPMRTFYSGIAVVCLAALFYTQGQLIKDGLAFTPNFFEALYFSVITFTTVGYGDITPLGVTKLLATIEAFCGIFIIPIFVIGLSRKYLRI